jgi:cytoskeletal protein RodZ
MGKKRKNKLSKISKPLLITGLVLVLGLSSYAFLNHKHNNSSNTTSKPNNSSPNSNINYGPPSNAEKQETQAHKDELAQSDHSQPPPPTSSGKRAVTPRITSTEGSQVYAYVPGVFEDGGTCTATFTQGTQKIVKTSQGFANATYTSCSPISRPSGAWTVIVSYSSSTAEGSSQATEIK